MNEITQFLMSHGGPVLFAVVFVEQAGLPLPSAPWLLAAGALWASGNLNPAVAIAVTALAAVMADSLWFYIGRRRGQRVLRLFCRLSLARNTCVGRTKGLFARHGLQALVVAKFLPGLGTVMPPLAGALGMRTSRFLLFDSFGSLFYGAFYIVAGSLFHNQLQQVLATFKQLGLSALVLMSALVTGYIAFKYARRRNLLSKSIRNQIAQRRRPSVTNEALDTGAARAPEPFTESPGGRMEVELPTATLALTSAPSQGTLAGTAVPLVPHPM